MLPWVFAALITVTFATSLAKCYAYINCSSLLQKKITPIVDCSITFVIINMHGIVIGF